jgi:hypothetical protein
MMIVWVLANRQANFPGTECMAYDHTLLKSYNSMYKTRKREFPYKLDRVDIELRIYLAIAYFSVSKDDSQVSKDVFTCPTSCFFSIIRVSTPKTLSLAAVANPHCPAPTITTAGSRSR